MSRSSALSPRSDASLPPSFANVLSSLQVLAALPSHQKRKVKKRAAFLEKIRVATASKLKKSPGKHRRSGKGLSSASLDFAFSAIVFDIQRRLKLVARVPKVRVEFWLRKLHELETNVVWKKNRNNHARLLLNNLSRGVLEHPFDKAPEEGRLKMLPQHALFAIRGDGFGATPASVGGQR